MEKLETMWAGFRSLAESIDITTHAGRTLMPMESRFTKFTPGSDGSPLKKLACSCSGFSRANIRQKVS